MIEVLKLKRPASPEKTVRTISTYYCSCKQKLNEENQNSLALENKQARQLASRGLQQ